MNKKRDYDKELVEKGVMVYDSKDKCYYIADGYTTDDVYDYINSKPKPKNRHEKILEKIMVLNDLKFSADDFTRSAAKIMGVSGQSVRDRRRLGDLLITYEKGDCTEKEKRELTKLYNRLKKSHVKLIKTTKRR